MRRYWELNGKPKNFQEAIDKGMYQLADDGYYHANSVAEREDGVYEFRVTYGNNEFRIFFIYDGEKLVILFNAFRKKTQKTPRKEIELAKEWANLCDVFVMDAFGSAHRAHASTEGVTHYLPSVAGFLIEKEIAALDGGILPGGGTALFYCENKLNLKLFSFMYL